MIRSDYSVPFTAVHLRVALLRFPFASLDKLSP